MHVIDLRARAGDTDRIVIPPDHHVRDGAAVAKARNAGLALRDLVIPHGVLFTDGRNAVRPVLSNVSVDHTAILQAAAMLQLNDGRAFGPDDAWHIYRIGLDK